ncbi:MAG: sigma 54-interacting transcriptional regulator [Deltaproteobacteria bacterium]|nr:sigma 54-interacting transcriptional regulator [Deltaproteobacteria bacterium]
MDATGEESPTRLIYTGQEPLLVLRAAVLHVVSGPDRGASCAVELERITVGTAKDNDLVLSDAGVSRRHLQLQVHDTGYLVRDLDSTNGTFHRGARVREVLLGLGAELRLADTVLRLEPGEQLSKGLGPRQSFGRLVGSSPAMQKLYGVLARVAPSDVTVLIQGETGSGKELVAEEIHRNSPRHAESYVVVDCGALPGNLIESELFGHERGAFTGAVSDRAGAFERANGGTVFLDEIGELPLELQTRLLRVLDARTVKRLGSNVSRKIDVRLVAATNRELGEEVKRGAFRRDLYYRLAVVRLEVPPLRKRPEDLPLLARHFLLQAGAADPDAVLTPELLEVLRSRRFRGNVRELRNLVERAIMIADGADLELGSVQSISEIPEEEAEEVADEPAPASRSTPPPLPRALSVRATAPEVVLPGRPVLPTEGWLARTIPEDLLGREYRDAKQLLLHQFETLYLGRLVERHGQNISAIAREAGLDRHMMRRLLRKHGLHE